MGRRHNFYAAAGAALLVALSTAPALAQAKDGNALVKGDAIPPGQ